MLSIMQKSWSLGLLCTSLWPLLLGAGSPMKKQLLGRAHKIAPVQELSPIQNDVPYFWISNREVVAVSRKVYGNGFTLVGMNGSARLQSALAGFLTRSSQWFLGRSYDNPPSIYMPPPCTLSPDGKWFLWLYDNEPSLMFRPPNFPHRMTWMVARLDGWVRLECPAVPFPGNETMFQHNIVWMPDSRHWLELAPEEHPRYRAVNGPNGRPLLEPIEPAQPVFENTRVLIHSLKTQGSQELPVEREIKLPSPMGGLALGFTHRGTVLVWSGSDKRGATQVKMQEVELKGPVARVRPYGIRLPVACKVYEVVLDRQGQRLAWVLVEPNKEAGVWVSNLAGKGMRQIGALEIEYDKDLGPTSEIPHTVRWLPDGKQLSFLYKNALWTVPAD